MNRRKTTILLLAVVAFVFCLLTTVGAGTQGTEPRGLEVAKAAQERHKDDLLEMPGVVGTAVGLGGDGQAAIQIFTENHGVAGLPASLDGIPVNVRVTGKIFAQSATDQYDRPVPIGVSTGSERLFRSRGGWYCSSGTLGARVVDSHGNLYALSNNHVYAQENKGQIGDRILQPGRADMPGCGTAAQIDAAVIGTLYSWVQISFSRKANNILDAALGLTSKSLVGTDTMPDGYGTPTSHPVDAQLNQQVQKYGRTTGLTSGMVSGINATVLVSYSSGTARFIDQIIITGNSGSFSDSGDSGSLIVDQNNNPVALLFAGSNTITIGNPIEAVLGAFNVSIDGKK